MLNLPLGARGKTNLANRRNDWYLSGALGLNGGSRVCQTANHRPIAGPVPGVVAAPAPLALARTRRTLTSVLALNLAGLAARFRLRRYRS